MNPADRFRQLALALPNAVESSHMGAADFRLNNRIFATLAFVARGQATLKLTPEQQQSDLPDDVEPAPGSWGCKGMTLIRLDAPEDLLRGALLTSYNNVQAMEAARKSRPKSQSTAGQPRKPKPKMDR